MNENITPIRSDQKIRQAGNGGNGGNNGVIDHRLKELERRAEKLENKIDSMNNLLIEINTKMDEKASKSWILFWVATAFGGAILTLLAHVIIRNLAN